jgi:hypothetical protein
MLGNVSFNDSGGGPMSESELIAMQAAIKAVLEQLGTAGSATPADAHASLKRVAQHYELLGGDANHEIAVQIAKLRGVRPAKKPQ